MDDIAMLRSLADDSGVAVRLFPPAPAYRVRPTGFTGTPMPKDEPMGSNPPLGAYIDYALNAASSGVVTLTISEARGAPVRSFSSSDKQPQPDLAKIDIAPEWIVPPEPLATGAGAHRFVWDLHYAPPQPALVPDESSEEEKGVWAPPGQYWIDLNVAGKRFRQRLTVLPDPRVRLPADAYARQFALARQVEAARVQIAATLAEANRIHAAIVEHRKNAGSATASALSAADRRLLAITDVAPDKDSPDSLGPAPKAIRGLPYLAAAFKSLARAVDGADTAPTPDALQGYAKHRVLLNDALLQWARFTTVDMPRLNAQLQSDGAAPIAPASK
jgi:hypothetical protein